MSTIPTIEPESVVSGNLWLWQRYLTEYPADAGFVLSYYFRGPFNFDVTAVASGKTHGIRVSPSTTAAYPAGVYSWQAVVSNPTQAVDFGGQAYAPGELRFSVNEGTMRVEANFAAMGNGPSDFRSPAKIAYEAAYATYTAILGKQITTGSIAGQNYSLQNIGELRKQIDQLRADVLREEKAERIKRGLPGRSTIFVRFGSPGL